MSANQVVEIKSYSAETDTYELVNMEFYGQGPLITTPEELARSVKAVDLKKIKRNPKSILGQVYKTDEVIVLMMPELIEKRKLKNKAK